jgi:hypothetical protein
MTPKEKAEELFNKLIPYTRVHHEVFGWENDKDSTKECALIAVDEIFEFMRMDDDFHEDAHFANCKWVGYWVEVKQEIEKL